MGLFKKEDRNIFVNYEIKSTKIEMPKEGECIIFQFPKETPREIIEEWDRRIVEFQNLGRSFITTTMNIKFFKNPKNGKLEVWRDEESNNDGRSGENSENRQAEAGNKGVDKQQQTQDNHGA